MNGKSKLMVKYKPVDQYLSCFFDSIGSELFFFFYQKARYIQLIQVDFQLSGLDDYVKNCVLFMNILYLKRTVDNLINFPYSFPAVFLKKYWNIYWKIFFHIYEF